jgi:hypothetical protein
VVLGSLYIILPKEVETKAVLTGFVGSEQFGFERNPERRRYIALEDTELDALTETLASLGHSPEAALTWTIEGADVIGHEDHHGQPLG